MMIQKLRLQRGWSQQQLAEMSGLSTRTIQRLENGNSASIESLKSLAAVFEVIFPFCKEIPPWITIVLPVISTTTFLRQRRCHPLPAFGRNVSAARKWRPCAMCANSSDCTVER